MISNTHIALSALTLVAASASSLAANLTDGSFYARTGISYQHADDYHSGADSFAAFVFNEADGEYTFINYTLDVAYTLPSGFYVATGVYATEAEVNTNGLGLGVPDTDSGVEPREIPLALGYQTQLGQVFTKFEARYTFNVDEDFDSSSVGQAVQDEVLLPVTDGSDYLTLSTQAKFDLIDLEHTVTVAYQIFEEDASHPLFPEYTLGDRIQLDYELGIPVGKARFFAGHLFVWSDETEGDSTGSFLESALSTPPGEAPVYLYEQPRYQQIRGGVNYPLTDNVTTELGASYIYNGSDAPKESTVFLAVSANF